MNLKKIIPQDLRGRIMYALRFVPDELYVKLFYFAVSGKWMDLRHPKGFNEKQNWLKLHDRHPEYSELVDKLAMRKHIDKTLGEGHLFPLLGTWERFEDIDWGRLPDAFVLKCNHDSGSVEVIRNKHTVTTEDKLRMAKKFNRSISRNCFYAGREYPYKGIQKRLIMAEQLMVDNNHPERSIEDYKFFCFDGEPKVMFVATDRATDCRFDFYDMDFNHLPIQNLHPNADKPITKPTLFDEMKAVAARLSQGMKFVRIDLYQLNGIIYFGEYTFYHGGAFAPFFPEEWEMRLGSWILLDGVDA